MLKDELLESYKFRIELHAHTNPVSSCSEIPAEDFAGIFIEDGYDGVVVTNHFTPALLSYETAQRCAEYYLRDFEAVRSLAGDKLSVCLGMEIRFTENNNDYLVYGIDASDVERAFYFLDKGIDVFHRDFADDRIIILQAHPFRNGMVLASPESVDGIEVFNFHPGHNSRIGDAAVYAARHKGMIACGGVDFHHQWQRGVFALRSKFLPKDSYDVSKLLKSGDYIFTVGDSIILP
ncbi:MAG: PHP domain-containing protein [Clostridia bacterium]|nr:PHP domain-containing protein [Clostridia bacterium]